MSTPRITGQLYIPDWNPTGISIVGDLVSGSATITSVADIANVVAGLELTGTGIDPGTTIISVDTGASSITLSSPVTLTSAAVVIDTTCPDGMFYCEADFLEVNGFATTADLQEGFIIINLATDAGGGTPLSGVFNTFEILKITNRPSSSEIHFFCRYEEGGSYSSLGRIPTPAVFNGISSQTDGRGYQSAISPQVYIDLPAGIAEAAYNIDLTEISDLIPVIKDENDTEFSGSWFIKFTGAGINSITEDGAAKKTVTIDISGASGSFLTSGSLESGSQLWLYPSSGSPFILDLSNLPIFASSSIEVRYTGSVTTSASTFLNFADDYFIVNRSGSGTNISLDTNKLLLFPFTGSAGISGSLSIASNVSASESPFLITIKDNANLPGTQALEVNNEGVLVLGAFTDAPTAVAGGIAFFSGSFWLGLD